ncbi:MAG: hypothetical protein GX933_00985 [Chloroflexi bacterium]|nr:hypothetical protein [Chloroflexota bacterium]
MRTVFACARCPMGVSPIICRTLQECFQTKYYFRPAGERVMLGLSDHIVAPTCFCRVAYSI